MKKNRYVKYSEDIRNEVINLHKAGMGIGKISRKLDIPLGTSRTKRAVNSRGAL